MLVLKSRQEDSLEVRLGAIKNGPSDSCHTNMAKATDKGNTLHYMLSQYRDGPDNELTVCRAQVSVLTPLSNYYNIL